MSHKGTFIAGSLSVSLLVIITAASWLCFLSQPASSSGSLGADPGSPVPAANDHTLLFESAGRLQSLALAPDGLPISAPVDAGPSLAASERVAGLYPSPDRTRAVVVANGDGETWTAYLFTPPDGRLLPLASYTDYGMTFKLFGWRPRTDQIAFWEGTGIWLQDVNTGERTLLAQPETWAGLPYAPHVDSLTFAPDGERFIVSFTLDGSGWEVWNAKVDGTDQVLLFESAAAVVGLAWAPDGSQIAMVAEGLEVMAPDGTGRRTIGHDFIGGQPPAWSPDSLTIAFTAMEAGPEGDDPAVYKGYYRVRVVDVQAGQERNVVADHEGGEILPSWSPDGRWLVFLSDRTGAPEVWMSAIDGTELRALTSDNQLKRAAPVWLLPGNSSDQ